MVHDFSREGSFETIEVDISDTWERRYWARIFGVSEDDLREAAKVVGPQIDKLRMHFRPVRGHKPYLVWRNDR